MESSTRNFFAGMAATFAILGFGFGGGLLMANSALKGSTGYQKSRVEQASPVRVILPTTAEAAEATAPPQQVSAMEQAPSPPPEQIKEAPPEKKVEKVDTKKAEREVRERRQRYAERKARREAARARQQVQLREQQEPRILAFGSDEPRQTAGFGFFGNN
jgi:predicted dienelactone hydrolase